MERRLLQDRKLVVRLHIHTLSIFFTFSFCFTSTHSQHAHLCFVSPPPFFSISRYLYADPLHCNMTYLLLRLLKDDLKEYTYAARLAGLVYGIASGMNAILVSKLEVGGINGRAHFEALAECGNGLQSLLVAAFFTNANVICDCSTSDYSPPQVFLYWHWYSVY